MEQRVWVMKELKKLSLLAAPMVVVSVSQSVLPAISLMMTGHLGKLQLSGVSIATSFTNATGFALLFGLSGALETLCGQAYGAGQYHKLGSYVYCSMISLLPICLPVSILWIFMARLLILIGLNPQISVVACKYSIGLIPALFGYAILQSLFRYFQSQSLILPMLLSSCATVCFHVPLCWALIYKWEFGNIGGAIAIGVAYWFNVIILVSYFLFSSSCEKTRILCWKDIFSSISEFCLEWWTFELLILLAGLLKNSKLETSVLSICITTTSLHYFVQYGIGAAASVRVSNELGSGNPRAARAIVHIVLVISLTEAVIASTSLFCTRYVFGYAFSNDKEVVDYVTEVAPLLCLSVIVDSLLAVLSGIARGCGWQRIGAFVNLGAYYFVGIPVSVVLCFVGHLRGKGLWIGLLVGTTVQLALFAFITASTNWKKQASIAKDRIFKGQFQQIIDGIEL
ncbi:protein DETOXIFICATION 8-like isoform X2 [Hevea brasiliensis]|uniref:protein DETOXIFICATION 8-like isoform X2 n=1 Tax=Hevea brasiliensis TaxID=3981 RepID=UPI0025F38A30|nr:protein DETOXIFICATION 8-like isoform X2 [Hevea brasiliensis]